MDPKLQARMLELLSPAQAQLILIVSLLTPNEIVVDSTDINKISTRGPVIQL